MAATELQPESAPPPPTRWSWPLLLVGFVVCVTPIILVGGFRDGFTYWNCLPVVLALVVLVVSRQGVAARTFAAVSVGFSILVHLAWAGDWGGTATGSSTSGLIFIFIPFWSIIFGVVASLIAWLVCRFAPRSSSTSHRHDNQE